MTRKEKAAERIVKAVLNFQDLDELSPAESQLIDQLYQLASRLEEEVAE